MVNNCFEKSLKFKAKCAFFFTCFVESCLTVADIDSSSVDSLGDRFSKLFIELDVEIFIYSNPEQTLSFILSINFQLFDEFGKK